MSRLSLLLNPLPTGRCWPPSLTWQVPDCCQLVLFSHWPPSLTWQVPDFCQLVLFSTPQRVAELEPQLRKLVLAMRRATGLIHRDPTRARAIFAEYAKDGNAAEPKAAQIAAGVSSWVKRAVAAINPFAAARRRRAAKADSATMSATWAI